MPNFHDETFNDSDWSDLIIYQVGSGSYVAAQQSTGGNPGYYRRLTHNVPPYGSIITGHLASGATYNPAVLGGIGDIDGSIDIKLIDGGDCFTVAYALMIKQEDSYYSGPVVLTTITPEIEIWVNHTFSGLISLDFYRVSGPGPDHPNFTASGSVIQVGYRAGNSTAGGATTTISGIDNWSVTLNEETPSEPLPEEDYSYTKGGRDMFLNKSVWVPKFTISDLPGVVFGGFFVDKYICSQPRSSPSSGAPTIDHGESPGGTAGRSSLGSPVWDYIMLSQAMVASCNRGKGWHLMTPFEWAALAWMSKKMNTMPHGGNANSDPPSDINYPHETAGIDEDLHATNPTWHRALPGTGPRAWSHTGQSGGGIYDLQGLVWQLLMGFLTQTNGYLRYPASFDIGYLKGPYGRGTISGSGGATPTLTCNGVGGNWLKNWTADAFNGASYSVFIAEANSGQGQLFENIQDTTSQTIVLANGANPGNGVATFVILKTLSVDITAGMLSGDKITSLTMDLSSDLSRLAIPLTSSSTGSVEWGHDVYYFDKASERVMCRGGCFSDGEGAGVFALSFSNDLNAILSTVGFRAVKAI